MKITLVILSLVFALPTFANETPEVEYSESPEELAQDVIRIRDVKEFISTMNPDATCLDEYLQRRKQLVGKLILSPVIIAAGTSVGFMAGAYGTLGIIHLVGNPGSWSSLGYIVFGGLATGAAVGGTTLADSGFSIFDFRDIDLISKALAEQYLGQSGTKSEKLYANYSKKNPNAIPSEEFFQRLMELDQNGKLCDGSMVKQPRIRLGFKLKYKVARTRNLKEFLKSLNTGNPELIL